MNISTSIITKAPVITRECVTWCKEQHFIQQNNFTVQIISIPLLALILLVAASFIYTFSDRIIKKTDLTEENLTKIYHLCTEGAKYLLIGFFVWWTWFR